MQVWGFYGVLSINRISLDRHLITTLVKRWRLKTHTFHLSVRELTITLEDEAWLWGLLVDGAAICERTWPFGLEKWTPHVINLLGVEILA